MNRQKKRTNQSTRYNDTYVDIKTERQNGRVRIKHRMNEKQ
jgi:hypothetical protein